MPFRHYPSIAAAVAKSETVETPESVLNEVKAENAHAIGRYTLSHLWHSASATRADAIAAVA